MKLQSSVINKEVANAILKHLGGNKFITMTGSKNFIYGENEKNEPYLRMQLTKNKLKAKYLIISLNWKDLYDMKFLILDKTKENFIILKEYNDVYNDMLQSLFTEATELYTHL